VSPEAQELAHDVLVSLSGQLWGSIKSSGGCTVAPGAIANREALARYQGTAGAKENRHDRHF